MATLCIDDNDISDYVTSNSYSRIIGTSASYSEVPVKRPATLAELFGVFPSHSRLLPREDIKLGTPSSQLFIIHPTIRRCGAGRAQSV
jgi:hypothetical protein